MPSTTFTQIFGDRAVSGTYAGAETVLHFGSPASELNELRSGCAAFDLGWRGKLVVSGEDRVRWLNGMVSNNTRDLTQDHGNYNFVLSPQGRIQADMVAYQRGDFYLLETEAAEVPVLREIFERYIIMDDVEIGDISTRLVSLGVGGPKTEEVLTHAGLVPEGLTLATMKAGQLADGLWSGAGTANAAGYTLVKDAIVQRGWFELWLAPENVERVWQALLAAGASPVGAVALEWQRILLGLPRMQDMGGKVLPPETGQEYALHYSKGCYIGQEIVERIHARGQVHRRLVGLVLEGAAPEAGTKLLGGADAKEVGEVASGAEIEINGTKHNLALAYVRQEFLTGLKNGSDGVAVTAAGIAARVVALPFTL